MSPFSAVIEPRISSSASSNSVSLNSSAFSSKSPTCSEIAAACAAASLGVVLDRRVAMFYSCGFFGAGGFGKCGKLATRWLYQSASTLASASMRCKSNSGSWVAADESDCTSPSWGMIDAVPCSVSGEKQGSGRRSRRFRMMILINKFCEPLDIFG